MCLFPSRRRFLISASAVALSGTLLRKPIRTAWTAEKESSGQWRSFRNGPANPGVADARIAEQPKERWSVTTSDGTTSTAVIADERVFMGTLGGDLLCLDLLTGQQIWKYRSVDVVEANSFAPGFNAPAALDERHVYLGDDQGTFHAVDRQTGQRAWQVETGGEIVGGAQAIAGKVIFGSHDGYLYCHRAEDGERVWSVETHGPVNGTPCISGKYTFTTGCDRPILRVFDIEKGEQAAEVPLESLLIASAAIREGILYFGSDSGGVFALDWQKKSLVWKFSVPNREQQIQSSPAVTDDVVVIGSRDKFVYCLDRKTGKLRWSAAARGKIDSSPVIAGDNVYYGSSDRNVYGLRLEDGKEIWKQNLKQPVTGSPAIASGCLVIGTDATDGRIIAFS
jgi:outer membrane protein assembly factor BamB